MGRKLPVEFTTCKIYFFGDAVVVREVAVCSLYITISVKLKRA